MRAPRKLLSSYQCKSGLDKGDSTSPTPNLMHRAVTNYVKLGGGRYRAATQVKGLSPEIIIVSMADTVHLGAGRTLITALVRL